MKASLQQCCYDNSYLYSMFHPKVLYTTVHVRHRWNIAATGVSGSSQCTLKDRDILTANTRADPLFLHKLPLTGYDFSESIPISTCRFYLPHRAGRDSWTDFQSYWELLAPTDISGSCRCSISPRFMPSDFKGSCETVIQYAVYLTGKGKSWVNLTSMECLGVSDTMLKSLNLCSKCYWMCYKDPPNSSSFKEELCCMKKIYLWNHITSKGLLFVPVHPKSGQRAFHIWCLGENVSN